MRIGDWSSDVCSSDRAAGRVDAVDDVEQGGLAGAVRPDHPLDFAFLDVEIDSVEHDEAAETLLQPPNLEQPHVSAPPLRRSEEHTSELQSLMRSSYAVFCLKKKTT